MKIFGGILPFIGWRQVWVDNDGEPCSGPAHFYADALEFEWFNSGAIVYIGNVYRSEPDDIGQPIQEEKCK